MLVLAKALAYGKMSDLVAEEPIVNGVLDLLQKYIAANDSPMLVTNWYLEELRTKVQEEYPSIAQYINARATNLIASRIYDQFDQFGVTQMDTWNAIGTTAISSLMNSAKDVFDKLDLELKFSADRAWHYSIASFVDRSLKRAKTIRLSSDEQTRLAKILICLNLVTLMAESKLAEELSLSAQSTANQQS